MGAMATSRKVIRFLEEGHGRDAPRPRFARLVEHLSSSAETDGVVVADLTRLFRTRRDRERIEAFLDAGRIDVISERENFDTGEPGGRERYDRAASQVMLAYDEDRWAHAAGESRAELAERYVRDALIPWLELRDVPAERIAFATADVRARLASLAGRWGTPGAAALLAAYYEIAERHDPRDVALEVRALATVGVRNSHLEDLHIDDHIEQWEWRDVTRAAANALCAFDAASACAVVPNADDPFAGILEACPTATAAFTALSTLRPGGSVEWRRPDLPAPAAPAGDEAIPLTPRGEEILHALDERISLRSAGLITRCAQTGEPFGAPSLKHISRHPGKLFRVVDYLLAHHVTVATANLLIEPEQITWRSDPVGYNDFDLTWAGVGNLTPEKVGRNDPCPCGSGLKYKRCCGR